MNRPSEQPSFVELPNIPGLSTTNSAEKELIKEFQDFDRNKIKYTIETKSGELKVGPIDPKKPYYDFITKIQGKNEYQLNPKLPKEVKIPLRKSRRETIEDK